MAEVPEIAATIHLVDEALLLRPYRPEDAGSLYSAAIESFETVGRWLTWCRADYVEADSIAWIAYCAEQWNRGDQYTFAIMDRRDGQFLGAVGLSQRNRTYNSCGMGYWIRHSAQGRGIAARAGRLVAQFGFAALAVGRIEILAATQNIASCRTAENIGAKYEGIAPNRLILPANQGAIDAAVYALNSSDIDL